MAPPILALGTSDFRKLRESGAYYVDKTGMVGELLRRHDEAVLLPRPRRFGKTLNLSMLQAFFDRRATDSAQLFAGLAVERDEEVWAHRARYPVIFLSFKGLKARSWEQSFQGIRNRLSSLYQRNTHVLPALDPGDRDFFEGIRRRQAGEADCSEALSRLCQWLHEDSGQRVILLVDEYDIPIQAGFQYDYFDEVVAFFRDFFSSGFKDNSHLFRGVLTGVLRLAKESVFSGLNNVEVYSLLSPEYCTHFGFLQGEVDELCDALGRHELREPIAQWYDGYRFGGQQVYNPWSVLSYLRRPEQGLRPYWVFTSSDDVLRGLVLEREHAVSREFEALLRGETVLKAVSAHVALRDLGQNPDALWNLLLLSGYLTARELKLIDGYDHAELAIPNQEVARVFRTSILTWVKDGLGGERAVQALLNGLLAGDERVVNRQLSQLVLRTFSYFSLGSPEPERVYQAFVLGLCVYLEPEYEVRSERESGYGRYDLAITPRTPGKPGVVLEFKVLDEFDSEPPEQALEAALAQIEAKRYATELFAAGAEPVHAYGVVFDGKRVWARVRRVEPPVEP